MALPACDARTFTMPAPVIVTVLPEMVAGPETMLKLTGSPDDAVALTANGGAPSALFASAPNVIVWLAGAHERLIDVAAPGR